MNGAERVEAVQRLEAVAAALLERAKAHRDRLEADARAELDRTGGAPTTRFPSATVSLSMSRTAVVVVNDRTFADHVATIAPDAVVPQVVRAWQDRYLRSLRYDETGVVFDDDGRVIPGLGVREGGHPVGIRIVATPVGCAVVAGELPHLVEQLAAADPRLAAALAPDDVDDQAEQADQ